MFVPVVVVLILAPLLELYVIIEVGRAIGVLPTLLLLLTTSMLGGILLRQQGARAWRGLQLALSEGRLPHVEVANGALVLLGGALMLAPGFVSDVIGLFFLLPPTRAVARVALLRYAAGRTATAKRRPPADRPAPPGVIEGETEEEDGGSGRTG
ncbi:MAG TPA: FxsA family protein [Mycobacteriales bacterium]|nr:FxsA family protein [Mycobacteriales bacterium]